MKSILSKRDISVMCLRFSHGQAMAVRDRGWKLFQSYQVMIYDLPGLLFMYASHILSSFGLCLGAIVSILDLGKKKNHFCFIVICICTKESVMSV